MEHNWFVIVVSAVVIAFCVLIFLIIYTSKKRERALVERLQKMIDEASGGTFVETEYTETRLSELETSMWHYLCNSNLFQSQMKEQKERIQTLISDISHQTVTPIANIKIYTELLEEQMKSIDAAGQCWEDMPQEVASIKKQVNKLDFLIQSLVKVSRLENGIITLDTKDNSVGELMEAVHELYKVKAEQKGITLVVEAIDEEAIFDSKWTLEALGNIVDNAIKYTSEGGKVQIRAEKYQMFLRIDIIDNGIGIEEKDISKIFQRFYRSHSVSGEKGVGIGLYLANEILKREKGYMKVTSELGKGSVFSVFLNCGDISFKEKSVKTDIFSKQP